MKVNELEKMWEAFSLVKFENGILDNSFYHWRKGTRITKILDWFHSNMSDVFYYHEFSKDLLENMWEEFEDIPINNDDEIELDFYCWKKGTCRFEVWHWFDEKLPNGLVADFNIDA